MNKNLLIAIGDSWTHGFGAYPLHILRKYGNPPVFLKWEDASEEMQTDIAFLHNHYMREKSWCTILAKKINYDIANLGSGGAANSSIAKVFYQTVYQNDYLSKYDKVLVMFLLSSPERISFYKNSMQFNLNLRNMDSFDEDLKKFCKYFITEIQFDYKDMCLESTYHLRTVEALCALKGFHFYYASAFTDINDISHDKSHCINPENAASYASLLDKKDIAKCGHPNEVGYIKMADIMYDELNKKGYEF